MPHSFLSRMLRLRIFGKSPVSAYLRLNKLIWSNLPSSLRVLPALRIYGTFLHTLARLAAIRKQTFGTFFLRNRPQLELIRRISDTKAKGSTLKISVLACSKGAEVHSILWTIRSARPDLKIIMNALDISKEVLEFAQKGVYSLKTPEFTSTQIFERITEKEMGKMFDKEEEQVRVKLWIREGIIWHLGDGGDPKLADILGPQDIVVANNFLCHMDPPDAERCLRNIARLVKQGGYLFVSGIDLDVRTRVVLDLGWKPLEDLIEDIHEGDPYVRGFWPWHYAGLEPLNKRRRDWKIRYASVFQLG